MDIEAVVLRQRPQRMSEAEWRLRIELAACYRIFDYLGWTELIYNHITMRVPGQGREDERHYLINPFGLNYAEVTATNLIKIRLDGTAVDPTPHPVNKAGFIIHSAIHAARNDAHCVMHTHTTAGIAIALKEGGLKHDDFYGAMLFGRAAYHDFEGISVRTEEQPRLVNSLRDKDVLILRNHGLLVCERDIPAAFRLMWHLQRACEVQCAADTIPGPNRVLSDAVRRQSAQDAANFEPRGKLERMLMASLLRRAGLTPGMLV
ncbi:MAG: class II aldolase/adducin family protein [Betaproteobacteria bacterium]|nr:class II aldolase/adducin family protein [Betaproteobacteria bacterium]